MKKWIRLTALFLVLAMLSAGLSACSSFIRSDEEKIRDQMDNFLACCNSGDLDGALDCLDKKSRSAYGAIFNIGNSLLSGLTGFGIDARDVMALVFGLSKEDLLEMQIQSIVIDSEETATVTVSISFMDPQTGQKIQQDGVQIPMIKENWDWYIDARIDWYALINEMSQY